ncbi:LysM peptidoglycan-binding domain-containing protein [Gracilibacillus massiliensis]|uniref:LysM peptidoglycan-binding domain-containing protein n=1 Tax=Gracilibacillus massiliensis TaxID=1564956 RepID=UPI00071DF655|nr:LysM peptidoglycan-binding domain-containing protein [Gracilibacillus massiliensis]
MHQNYKEDQASSLRNQINTDQTKHEIDSLPSRKEVHKSTKKKNKWKLSFPFIRFILLLFIVIILLLLTIKFWGEEYLSSAETEDSDQRVEQVFIKLNQSNTSINSPKVEEQSITTHEVERMDTLFSISEKYYGTSEYVKEIIDANQLENHTLIVGEEIIIPNLENR